MGRSLSVFTCIGVPLRDEPRNTVWPGLIVSVDFQLSVLELVAELLRKASFFLVIVDQQSQLSIVHMRGMGGGGGGI